MKKRLINLTRKSLVISLVASLVLGLMGSFVLAKGKDLTPYEWGKLSADEKLEYKTIVIKSVDGGRSWMEEEKRDEFSRIMHTGDINTPTLMYSKALFEYLHPKVKVEHIDFNTWGPIENLMAGIAGGTAPSCYPIWTSQGPRGFIEAGLAADITELVETWDMTPYLKETLEAGWEYGWKNGRCYGIPGTTAGTRCITFRKDWFKQVGIFNEKGEPEPSENWTWDDFRDIAVKLTDVKKNRWGCCYVKSGYKGNQLGAFIAGSFGVIEPFSFVTPDKSGKYTWQVTLTPQLLQALQFIKDLRFRDNCMLVGEGYYNSAYRQEFKASRVGMVFAGNGDTLGDILSNPYLLSPDVPLKDMVGIAYLPSGRSGNNKKLLELAGSVIYGFNPTLSKEELKAAFEWHTWVYSGMGRELTIRKVLDELPMLPEGLVPSPLDRRLQWVYPLRKEIPEIPAMEEYTPAKYIEMHTVIRKLPVFVEPYMCGLRLNRRGGSGEEVTVMNSFFQTLVTDPNCDIKAEFTKAANILNKTVYNYKIEGDKEKMKTYIDALVKFYKENFPEVYKSKDFEEQLSYFKVW